MKGGNNEKVNKYVRDNDFNFFHISHKKNRDSIQSNGLQSPFTQGITTGLNKPESNDSRTNKSLSKKIYFLKYQKDEAYEFLHIRDAAPYILNDEETDDDIDIWILDDKQIIYDFMKHGKWKGEYYIKKNNIQIPLIKVKLATDEQRTELGMNKAKRRRIINK
jgi:hypothetical protein